MRVPSANVSAGARLGPVPVRNKTGLSHTHTHSVKSPTNHYMKQLRNLDRLALSSLRSQCAGLPRCVKSPTNHYMKQLRTLDRGCSEGVRCGSGAAGRQNEKAAPAVCAAWLQCLLMFCTSVNADLFWLLMTAFDTFFGSSINSGFNASKQYDKYA